MEKKCTGCKQIKPFEEFPKDAGRNIGVGCRCLVCNRKRTHEYHIRMRKNAIEHYSNGSFECGCCGSNYYEFLVIDHINGGGNKHRKTINKGGTAMYRWFNQQKFPPGYRVLCANCNHSLGAYGYCPHQKENNCTKMQYDLVEL